MAARSPRAKAGSAKAPVRPRRPAGPGPFEALVRRSPQPTLVVQGGRAVYANESLARLLGYPNAEDVTALRGVAALCTKDDAAALREYLADLTKGGADGATITVGGVAPAALRFQGLRQDGSVARLVAQGGALEWEGAPAAYLTLREIPPAPPAAGTAAAAAATVSRQLLQTVFDTIPYWVFVKDRESHLLMVNSAFAEACGMTPDEMIGLATHEIPMGEQVEHVGFMASDRQVLETGQRVELTQPITRPDGSKRVHNLIKMPLRDDAGQITGLVGMSEDITERAQTRHRLVESKFLLDTILEHIPSALSVVDGNLNLSVYNDRFLTLLDFPREQAQRWTTFEDFTRYNAQRGEYGAGDVETQVQERVELARQFMPHHFERRRPDGRVLEIRGNPLPHGGFISIYTDITDRKSAEEALATSARSQAIAQQVARLGSWTWEPQEDRVYWSDELYRLLGCQPQEFPGNFQKILEFVHPDDRDRFADTIREAVRGEAPYDFEHRIIRTDGAVRTMHERAEVISDKDGRPLQVVGTMHDITERKEAEQALHDSELRLRTLVLNLPVLLFSLDATGRVLFAAGKALSLLRVKGEEVVGTSALEMARGRPEILEDIERALRGEEVHSERRLGHTVLEFRYTPLEAEPGNPAVTIGLGLDITERKQFEQELADGRDNLERTVVQRTSELQESLRNLETTNLQLEEANRSKSRFLSSMSHELRTPLNGILGFADLLLGQHFGTLNAKQRTYATQIDTSGKHLLSLINDLLDIAKIDAGGMSVDMEPLAVSEFLASISNMMSSQFVRKGVMLEVRVKGGLDTVYADGRKLRQILLNLLSNALKFTERGRRVQVFAEPAGEAAFLVSVVDEGIGIEEDELPKVFSEFHQGRRSREEQYSGTGIGLALTRRLVELHGGEIGVKSTAGKGSTFWFRLPLRAVPRELSPVASEPARSPTVRMKPKRILVAEDNEVNLALILDILSIQGHETIVARNGQEAIDLAMVRQPELILMDVRMPVLDGLEATKRLRELEQFKDLPIIALTASTGSSAEERQLSAGMTAHLAKPIQAQELFAVLQQFLPA